MRSQFSSLLACALSLGASACQFETSPFPYATACGAASGVPCTTMNAAASTDASTATDFGPGPAQPQMPAAMQPSTPTAAPGQAQSHDAGAMPAVHHDAGVQMPPPAHDVNDAAAPSDAGASPSPRDAAPVDDASHPDTTKRGAAFDSCAANSECASGLCTVEPSTGASAGTHGYCTMGCGPNGWTAGGGGGWTGTGGSGDAVTDPIACAQPSSGSVTASCQYPGLCLLDACDTSKTCPDGLECVQTQTPTASQDGQVVWVSACQVKAAP
jgi:hypothetical protein